MLLWAWACVQVWQAIYEENCFEASDSGQCLEKRVFYRLFSGLQASITTHIASDYFYPRSDYFGGGGGSGGGGGGSLVATIRTIVGSMAGSVAGSLDGFFGSLEGAMGGSLDQGLDVTLDGRWGPNVELFVERVGRHPERLHNLYFTCVGSRLRRARGEGGVVVKQGCSC